MRSQAARRRARVVLVGAFVVGTLVSIPASQAVSTPIGPHDWRTYQHDAGHSGQGVSTLTATTVQTLLPRWFFRTSDIVTAQPVVVGNSVYVGTWDGNFYAIDRATGAQRWMFHIKPQPAVDPSPYPNHVTSDGGYITSSAWYEPGGTTGHPDLILFGGGYTLYALDAHTGHLVWSLDHPGRSPADPNQDQARIFSSPVVDGGKVFFGVTADGQNNHRGYVVADDLYPPTAAGQNAWVFETDVDGSGHVINDGCGGVWSSLSVDPGRGHVLFDVADCHFLANRQANPYNERVVALNVADGTLAWRFTPPRLLTGDPSTNDPQCDWDFGSSVVIGRFDAVTHKAGYVGVGGKDGTYYRIDPDTGHGLWNRNVVFGGFAGGFINGTAFDGRRAYAASALGDFGRFETNGLLGCQPGNPRDLPIQEPSLHAFNAGNGSNPWKVPEVADQSFGPTTVSNHLIFTGGGINRQLMIHDTETGLLLKSLPLPAPTDSGVAIAGNAVFVGIGSSEQIAPAGVMAFTTLGQKPRP